MFYVFCFNQMTAYELRISDWSSDVCSSDLPMMAGGKLDDGTAFRRLVGERREQRRLGQLLRRHTGHRYEGVGHAVAEGDGAGLVEEQGIDVARRFHGPARGGDHVEAHQQVHAGEAEDRKSTRLNYGH